jgi:hypothetical protein
LSSMIASSTNPMKPSPSRHVVSLSCFFSSIFFLRYHSSFLFFSLVSLSLPSFFRVMFVVSNWKMRLFFLPSLTWQTKRLHTPWWTPVAPSWEQANARSTNMVSYCFLSLSLSLSLSLCLSVSLSRSLSLSLFLWF